MNHLNQIQIHQNLIQNQLPIVAKMMKKLEEIEFKPSNFQKTIKRSWIIKRPINLSYNRVLFHPEFWKIALQSKIVWFFQKSPAKLPVPEKSKDEKLEIFDSRKYFNRYFKHWTIILELSNNSFVNIQFGRNGFSLKEFNQTEIKGENILDAILYTWGEKNEPVSFCYLGNVNFDYEKLILREK